MSRLTKQAAPGATQQLKVLPTLNRQNNPLATAASQLKLLNGLRLTGEPDFRRQLQNAQLAPLGATGIDILQLNLGRVCNQTCAHCHVDAGPDRKENMSRAVADACLRVLAKTDIPTVDITGGAPEMCPEFRYLVEESRRLGKHVIDRCNLTILLAKRYQELPQFLADNQVEIICSLPHYRSLNTDKQRGDGVFEASIEALQRLNALGYGRSDSGLRLVLVTNPVGAFLPAGQASMEADWKREMKARYDIEFNALFSITNMPISRYLEWLERTENLAGYMQTLVNAFNPSAARGVMCRSLLSVGWDGRLFDCDFNQMLDLQIENGQPATIENFELEWLAHREIITGRHCFGCTAGAGSSCGGATA